MKRINFLFASLGIMFSMALMLSCSSDDNGRVYTNALVTVKPNADNTEVFLQLDDNTSLFPVNMQVSPFGKKEVRALTCYYTADDYVGQYKKAVYVSWIDSILTKSLAPNYSAEENLVEYGVDGVEIVNDWVTIAEDGYLTLRFRTYWGGRSVHYVNLVYRTDVNNPYTVTFYHDANGDNSGVIGDALVAFKLDGLPDTKGETVDLTLQWQSFSGMKSTTFKYCTRKSTNVLSSDKLERIGSQKME